MLLEAARIPRRYERYTLANYRPDHGEGTQLRAFNYAFKLVHEYPAVGRGLLFAGPVGSARAAMNDGSQSRATRVSLSGTRMSFAGAPARRPLPESPHRFMRAVNLLWRVYRGRGRGRRSHSS